MDFDFIEIDGVFVNAEIMNTNFTCDLSKCKGACCTMESQYGAPVTVDEIGEIEGSLAVIKKYLSAEHVREIEKNGFWVEKEKELMIRSVENRACVFVQFEGDIAKCGIEKAYRDGKIGFNKPVSCHLFPIRVSNFGGSVLRYERYSECAPALEKGRKSGIKIIDFCEDAVKRAFGKNFLNKLKKGTAG
jgi:Protein of unknown function (DUF3109)